MRRIRFHSPDCTSRDARELNSASSGRAEGAVPLAPFGAAVEVEPAVDVDAMGANADMMAGTRPLRRVRVADASSVVAGRKSVRSRVGVRETGRQALGSSTREMRAKSRAVSAAKEREHARRARRAGPSRSSAAGLSVSIRYRCPLQYEYEDLGRAQERPGGRGVDENVKRVWVVRERGGEERGFWHMGMAQA